MRQIKFRAWCKTRKRMISDIAVGDGFVGEQKEDNTSYFESRHDADLTPMQFTGLLDKNGKEIYEGDIIKGWHDFGPGGEAERTGVIGWNGDGYGFNYWRDLEVIGNIHENPELLK